MKAPKVAASAWTILIVAACSIPGSSIPDISFDVVDKIAHFVLFAGFGWLWMAASTRPAGKAAATVISAGLLLGLGTEIYQGLLPWERTPDPMDVVFNALGLLTAVAIYTRARKA